MDIIERITEELSVKFSQVASAVKLLDEGATVPFIARYRKEATGALDDQQLRQLEERLNYLRELKQRRDTILRSIDSQGKLTADLKKSIDSADTKTLLEDLYLPFKPKRRTKAQLAREAGLEPLIESILKNRRLKPKESASDFINVEKGVNDADAALDGARHILIERLSENAGLLKQLREKIWSEGILCSKMHKGKETEGSKFKDYFEYSEAIAKIPSHRALALFRGENLKILNLELLVSASEHGDSDIDRLIAKHVPVSNSANPGDHWLLESVSIAWKSKLRTRIETDLMAQLKAQAGTEAIRVFANNLKDLILTSPAGAQITMGLDPGIRTGVKVVVVDGTGKLIDATTIYPHPPKKQWDRSIAELKKLIERHGVQLISIGNGTGSRETDQLVAELIKTHKQLDISKIMVSEAGASVYSASQLASEEFPDLDVSLRGAVSIARRLQDPLAELVKINAKSIGVGQYQHDVNQSQLTRSLDSAVEDCVNAVGVDVNTASPSLLKQISGINHTISQNIVEYRNNNGRFTNRKQLKNVPRLGEKAFEQAAGFLRITNGENPLDASAVHPEAYPVVEAIIRKTNNGIKELIGQSEFLNTLSANDYTNDRFGIPTINDIFKELEKPGRDPRPEFKNVKFKEGVENISDLVPGMTLEGVVTNVTNFGAFIDIGVHQDGLVHISHLADRFVKDPRTIVKTGDLVKVFVLEIDLQRRRIALSMKSNPSTSDNAASQTVNHQPRPNKKPKTNTPTTPRGAMAQAFDKAQRK